MTSWWWRRSIRASHPPPQDDRHDEQAAADDDGQHFRSVALVVGATGIVGTSLVAILPLPDTPGGPWKVYALSRRPLPPWASPSSSTSPSSSSTTSITHVQVDLTDPAAVAEALTPLTDITHVFYAALSPPPRHMIETPWNRSKANNNAAMLRNVLSVVVPSCAKLAHVCLQTGTKHYTGPAEAIAADHFIAGGGGILRRIFGGGGTALSAPYTEDMPRRLGWRNFYYDQEDALFDAVAQSSQTISWSVHRPSLILGFSPRSAMNVVCSLCVYAAICRKERVPLRWPGSKGAWEGFSTASDADLVAEQQIWAAVTVNDDEHHHPMAKAKNEAFNCSNGDVFRWAELWPVLAGRFGMEWVGYEGEKRRVRLASAMPRKGAVWAEIVRENGLVATELHEVVANWWFVDGLFYAKWEFLDSMNKSRSTGSRDSGTRPGPSVLGSTR